jgi:adenosylcobinamide kinase / adenosylcobinamide-phosphate guanylyltransferase
VTSTVLLGGARSGKSALAVELGRRWGGAVSFVATAEVRDEDMRRRVARHSRERPEGWNLVEEPLGLEALPLWRSDELVIVDCLTLWVANLLDARGDEEAIVEQARRLAELAGERRCPTIFVSNEVGLGIVPATPLGRRFRDLLGGVNRIFVERADHALFLVAGRVLRLDAVPLEDILT